jgi:hypothetical protein
MIRCPRDLDGRLDHLLAVNTVRIALAMGLPDASPLTWWRSDWELRAHSQPRTIPDALFAIEWPDLGERVFALEVEHGTRAPRNFQTKLLRYAAASSRRSAIYGATNPVVLVVGHNPTWLSRYRTALVPLALSLPVGFARLLDIQRHGAVGAVWQGPAGDERHSLRDLATLPYCTEWCAPDSPGKSSVCAAGAAHKSPLTWWTSV